MGELLQYRGNCTSNPFPDVDTLIAVIVKAKKITKPTFFRHCESPNEETCALMRRFPFDYTWWKSTYDKKPVYFYEWSRMEYFYM